MSTVTRERSELGSNLRRARRAVGLTQRTLALALGCESITVSRWERGVTEPSLSRLREIARITRTDLVGLIAGGEKSGRSL